MSNLKNKLNSNWITGFVDAEGCFHIRVTKDSTFKTGWTVKPYFVIKLHKRDKELLEKVKLFFNDIGKIRIKNNSVYYEIYIKDQFLNIILPHFEKYPLITEKQNDFIIFKKILSIINKKEHNTEEGLLNIVNLKTSMNKGISLQLKECFSKSINTKRDKIILPENINYDWFAGFFTGEGCFFIDIFKSKMTKLGYCIRLRITIGQHSRDELLVNKFVSIFQGGFIYKSKNYISYSVSKFEDIYDKLIPFFNQYKIIGVKLLDFQDFCKAAELINKKAHLTLDGFNEIKEIKSRMNKARYINNK